MELISPEDLERLINAEFERFSITRGLKISVYRSAVVFEEGNNWSSFVEPLPECRATFQPTPEAKKMIQKLLGDMRLKYNLKPENQERQ